MDRAGHLNIGFILDWIETYGVDPAAAAKKDIYQKRWMWALFWLIPLMAGCLSSSLWYLSIYGWNQYAIWISILSGIGVMISMINLGVWMVDAVKFADDPEPYMFGVHLARFMETCNVTGKQAAKLTEAQRRGLAKNALKVIAKEIKNLQGNPLNVAAWQTSETRLRGFRILHHSFHELRLVDANWGKFFKNRPDGGAIQPEAAKQSGLPVC